MSSTTRTREEPQSATEQVKERVQEVTQQARGETREQMRSQISERSTQVGDQVVSAAQAMRRASQQLHDEGNVRAAGVVDSLVERGEHLGGYLRVADGDKILRDVEDFARRQPWVMVGGSAIAGFLASRFMKASSRSRYVSPGPPAASVPTRSYSDDLT
jgi:uncharacterized protein YpuA (DUF1002 family)